MPIVDVRLAKLGSANSEFRGVVWESKLFVLVRIDIMMKKLNRKNTTELVLDEKAENKKLEGIVCKKQQKEDELKMGKSNLSKRNCARYIYVEGVVGYLKKPGRKKKKKHFFFSSVKQLKKKKRKKNIK